LGSPLRTLESATICSAAATSLSHERRLRKRWPTPDACPTARIRHARLDERQDRLADRPFVGQRSRGGSQMVLPFVQSRSLS